MGYHINPLFLKNFIREISKGTVKYIITRKNLGYHIEGVKILVLIEKN